MKEKNVNLSAIRAIAMIMIISCHILQGLENKWAFWVNLGVPIFFFISGYLYGNKEVKSIKEFYISRIWKILVPCSLWIVMVVGAEWMIYKKRYSALAIIASLLGFGGFYQIPPVVSHTWFVSYILICYLLIPFFQFLLKGNDFTKDLKCFLAIVLFLQILQEFHVLSIDVSWITNFLMGYFYIRCCKKEEEKKDAKLLLIAATLFFTPFAIFFQENIPVSLPRIIQDHSSLWIQYGHVMLGSSIFMLLYELLQSIPIKYNKILTFSDDYSYYIYLVHQVFILYTFSLLKVTRYISINIGCILIATIISAIILQKIHKLLLKWQKRRYH